MDVIEPDQREAVEHLRWLVSKKGSFTGSPVRDEHGQFVALVYARWWRSRHVDVVSVEGPRQAQAYRASGIDPARPDDLHPASLLWQVRGAVPEVVEAVAALPRPAGASLLLPGECVV